MWELFSTFWVGDCAQRKIRHARMSESLTSLVATVSGLGLHDYRVIAEDNSAIPGQSLVHIYQVRRRSSRSNLLAG